MAEAAVSRGGRRIALLALALLAAAFALTACGDDDSGGSTELSFFIFNEPSGVIPTIADRCSKQSNGDYTISFEYLPSDADQQREQLVRRLGAEDSSIDIIGMDVIWTGEFANAGWIEEWTGEDEKAVTEGVFPSVAETARFEDKLWGAPIWSNTQLLWYRTDRVPNAAEDLGGDAPSGRPDRGERADPGAGEPLRGPRRLAQLDGRVGGDEHRPARRRREDRPRAGGHREGADPDGGARAVRGGRSVAVDVRRGHRPPLVRGGRVELHAQLPVRLPEREGERARRVQEHGPGALPAGRRRASRRRRRSAGSTWASPATRRTRTWRSRRSSACASPPTRSRSRPRAACPR